MLVAIFFVVRGQNDGHVMAAYSNYLVMMNPGPEVVVATSTGSMGLIIQIFCGLAIVALVLLSALCLLHQYTKQAHAQAVEMITFRTSLRYIFVNNIPQSFSNYNPQKSSWKATFGVFKPPRYVSNSTFRISSGVLGSSP